MKVIWTKFFGDDVDYYIRKKKYKNIVNDIQSVVTELKKGNLIGDELENICVDGRTFKVRVANSSAKVGKSNGFRLIYYVVYEEKAYLLTIYSKKDDIKIPTDSEIRNIIKKIQ